MHGTSNDAGQAWSDLLDELKHKESLPNDARLAAALGITRSFLCSIRKGRKNVSLNLAKEIFLRLGKTFDIAALERLLLPKEVRSYTKDLSSFRKSIIERAKGRCELCNSEAPFRDADGTPFLEVHHLLPVSAVEKSTTFDNVIALCPNCHRKVEHSPTLEDKKRLEFLAVKYSVKHLAN